MSDLEIAEEMIRMLEHEVQTWIGRSTGLEQQVASLTEERDRLKAENRTLRNTCVTLEEVAESRRLKKTSVCPSCGSANPQPGF